MPKKHVLALTGVVVIAVAAAALLPGRKSANAPTAPATEQAQLPLGQGTPGNAQPNQDGSNAAIEFAGNSKPMPLPLVGQSQPVMRGPLAEAAGSGDGEETTPIAHGSSAPPTVTTTAPPPGVPAGPAATPVPVPTPAPAAPVAAARPAPAPAPVHKAPVQVATAKPEHKAVEKKPEPVAAAKPAAGGAGAGWYKGQAAGNYVVQILGTSSEATAQNYVKEQGGEYRYFKKTLQGKPLYVITYGSFSNRDAAVAAIKNLPAKVQAGKPWPRSVASVQQDLASTR